MKKSTKLIIFLSIVCILLTILLVIVKCQKNKMPDPKPTVQISIPSLPLDNLNILSPPSATMEQAIAWAKERNADPLFIELAPLFWKISLEYNVNPIVTYAQSALETGYMHFYGFLDASYHNPCGLKITEGGSDTEAQAHKVFKNWEEGIRAQVEHLCLYAGAPNFPKQDSVDPRHFDYLLGTAQTVVDLGEKWAPASHYGEKILELITSIIDTTP